MIKDHTEAMNLVLEALLSKEHGVISSISEIGAVGHRRAARRREVHRLVHHRPALHGRH